MNIREELLKNKIHMRSDALRVAAFSVSDKKHFDELMNCFLSSNYRLAQRAAWSVSWAAKQHPKIIIPYIQTLVKQLNRKNVHPAITRNSLRILQNVEVPENLHGELMSECFNLIAMNETPVAIKAFALTVLGNLAKQYPEIKPELELLIIERIPHETAAFQSRAKKILKQKEK